MKYWMIVLIAAMSLLLEIGTVKADTQLLTGTIRDFTPSTNHDFQATPSGLRPGVVQSTLSADQKPVYIGSVDGTFHGQATFDQWYRNVPGVNLSIGLVLTLENSPANPNFFTYNNSSFFPIDNKLFGNYPGTSHNYHFTFESHSKFTYRGGEIITFTGNDDLWVFINNRLAIDLGGIHVSTSVSITLDATKASLLDLTVGNTYNLDLFFAQRHTTQSNFSIGTSLILTPVPPQISLSPVYLLLLQ